MKVVIMRGVPGSGKSFLAEKMIGERVLENRGEAVKVSADDYFLNAAGEYVFNPANIGEAHNYCFRRFMEAIERKASLIVVDNTNLSAWEMAPYIMAANAYGFEYEIVNVSCDARDAFDRQSHGVPFHAHDRMCRAFVNESLPPFWRMRKVFNNAANTGSDCNA
jgi:tRNA uridine 5-carbamoylmethylation protein Kti12